VLLRSAADHALYGLGVALADDGGLSGRGVDRGEVVGVQFGLLGRIAETKPPDDRGEPYLMVVHTLVVCT
jgi:hypothetical protein